MSLAAALGDHPSDLIDGGVDLNQVNANDGEKIVGNISGQTKIKSCRRWEAISAVRPVA
jgi:hypothetical protein